jgi:ABC-2 type transport system permease protein
LWQSLVALGHHHLTLFLVFGTAIGSRMSTMSGVEYGSFIVPGLIMLSVLTQSIMNASFGISFRSLPALSTKRSQHQSRVRDDAGLCRGGGTKSVILALVTLATAACWSTCGSTIPC